MKSVIRDIKIDYCEKHEHPVTKKKKPCSFKRLTWVTRGINVCSTDFVRISSVILVSLRSKLDCCTAAAIFPWNQPRFVCRINIPFVPKCIRTKWDAGTTAKIFNTFWCFGRSLVYTLTFE